VNEFSISREKSVLEDGIERRANPRFPLELPVSYWTMSPPFCVGPAGTTLNISRNGLLFETTEDLQPGQHIVLSVEWPARLDNRVPLNLILEGRILRCENGLAAMQTHKHEFKTRKSAPAQQGARECAASGGDRGLDARSSVRIAAQAVRMTARPA
jgi:hypothetical protein